MRESKVSLRTIRRAELLDEGTSKTAPNGPPRPRIRRRRVHRRERGRAGGASEETAITQNTEMIGAPFGFGICRPTVSMRVAVLHIYVNFHRTVE